MTTFGHAACSFSFMLASESLFTLESIVTSVKIFLDKLEGNSKQMNSGFVTGAVPILRRKLGTSAQKLLMHRWDSENLENGWRSKVRLNLFLALFLVLFYGLDDLYT